MDDPREVEIMKAKVARQRVTVAKLMLADMPDPVREARIRRASKLFGDLYKSGPAGRELALNAVLTPEEHEIARKMKRQAAGAPERRGLHLPWLHRGARIVL